MLPKHFPKWHSVYDYFRQWRITGDPRYVASKKKRSKHPTADCLDSQSVKTTEVGGDERGFDAGKKVNGRKRHLLVETLGLMLIFSIFISPISARNQCEPIPYIKVKHPEWARKAVIYQINTRAFTKEGIFRAAEKHLPRLKELGIDILWIMPIHKIGEKNCKGTLESPYSVKDYYSVNPESGTMEDLKHFVSEAHKQRSYVILNWVANHTAWDN